MNTPSLAEYLSIAADATLADRFDALQALRTEIREHFPALVLHTAKVPLAPIACPFVSRMLRGPFELVPLHRALPRALGPSNTDARYAAQYDIDWNLDTLDMLPSDYPNGI